MNTYSTVLRFTPTKMGVAKIHHNAWADKDVRVIPENGRPNEKLDCDNSFVPENGHILYATPFYAYENGRS